MELISIIIPIYNSGRHLTKTLDSILAQSYADWETILIDDGSLDDSPAICDEYARKDTRFKVFHQNNAGVGAARNFGLSMAQGEYITFCDSDDIMTENHLSVAIQKIGDADLCIFGFQRFGNRTDRMTLHEEYISGHEACKNYMYNLKENGHTSEFFCFPWNKLYKRSLLLTNNITFPTDISLREDEIFTYRYIPFLTSIVVIEDALQLYNDEPSGLSAKKIQPEKALALAHHLIQQTNEDCSETSKTTLFFRAMIYMEDALINTSSWDDKLAIAKKMIDYNTVRRFTLSGRYYIGKRRHLLAFFLNNKCTIGILLLAQETAISRWYRIHIKKDQGLIRWGTNV